MIRSFNGKTPRVAASAFVSETAYVIGDVEIDEGSGIFPGAVVRGDFANIKIGRNSFVHDNCVLHAGPVAPLEVGDNVTIGHGVVVHCRRVGNNTLIGNNATILDDAEIGDFCIIAAGSVVRTGAKVPDRSFVVGVPGEVKAKVSSEQIQRSERGRKLYVDIVRKYKEEQGL